MESNNHSRPELARHIEEKSMCLEKASFFWQSIMHTYIRMYVCMYSVIIFSRREFNIPTKSTPSGREK